jgi:hypothetical protein
MKHQAFDRLAQVLADEFAAADLARLVGLPEARLA